MARARTRGITPSLVLGDLLAIAMSDKDPVTLKHRRAQAAARIDQYKVDLATLATTGKWKKAHIQNHENRVLRKLETARSGAGTDEMIILEQAIDWLINRDKS